MIDELQRRIAHESVIGLAYIYCVYDDQKEQTTENILGAFLKQLLHSLQRSLRLSSRSVKGTL